MAKQPKRLGAPGTEADPTAEAVEKYLKLLRDYQNVVFAVVVLVLTIGVLAVWSHQRSQEQEDAAWAELGKTRDLDLEKLKPLLSKFEGTDAHAFLVLAYTGKLYEHGEKADLEQAKSLLEHARDEIGGNKIMSEVVEEQLKGVKGELADAKLWNTAPVGSGSK